MPHTSCECSSELWNDITDDFSKTTRQIIKSSFIGVILGQCVAWLGIGELAHLI